jgi:F-type H+-transporting ATPase subunit a
VVASALFCGYIPFVLLPNNGIAMGLPVISVPGEKLGEIGGAKITNTIVATLLADIVVLLFAFGATRKMREVPGRLQGLFEILTDALYGVAKSTAGPNARRIFPFMATLFLFVLTANWLELLPGVDSVGFMHCAEDGLSGYPTHQVLGIDVLKVERPDKGFFNAGERATEADYEACHEAENGHNEAVSAAHAEGEGEAVAAAEDADVKSDIHMVTPFVRGAATDLNLTLGLALLAVLVVQYFGVRSLGISYFTKFVNTPALENAGKKPMGIMDFATGLLEIVSEISRVVSFGFRLFGNIFAGQVLLFVIPFLAGMLVPIFIYGFELFVGVIQAFVFGMLFLVFSAMAMQGHGHDETHEESH